MAIYRIRIEFVFLNTVLTQISFTILIQFGGQKKKKMTQIGTVIDPKHFGLICFVSFCD